MICGAELSVGYVYDSKGKRVKKKTPCELKMSEVYSEDNILIGWHCICGNTKGVQSRSFSPCSVCKGVKGHQLGCRNKGIPTEYQACQSSVGSVILANPSDLITQPPGSTKMESSAQQASVLTSTVKDSAGTTAATARQLSKETESSRQRPPRKNQSRGA